MGHNVRAFTAHGLSSSSLSNLHPFVPDEGIAFWVERGVGTHILCGLVVEPRVTCPAPKTSVSELFDTCIPGYSRSQIDNEPCAARSGREGSQLMLMDPVVGLTSSHFRTPNHVCEKYLRFGGGRGTRTPNGVTRSCFQDSVLIRPGSLPFFLSSFALSASSIVLLSPRESCSTKLLSHRTCGSKLSTAPFSCRYHSTVLCRDFSLPSFTGGWRRIRTSGTREGTSPFQDGALSHSATHP